MLTLVGNVAYAQETYTLLEPLPCIDGTGNNCKNGDVIPTVSIRDYISYVFKFAIALAVFLATVVIIWAGFEYMWSEIPFVKSNAKGRIQNAIMGLLAALASFLILQTIDPRLVQINTELPMIKIAIDKDTLEFQKKLSADLKGMTTETLAVVSTQEEKIQGLAKEISEVEKILSNPNSSAEEVSSANIKYQKLISEKKKLESEQLKTIASSQSISKFRLTLDSMYSEGGYKDGGMIIDDNRLETINSASYDIIKLTNDHANKLDAIGDHDGAQEIRTTGTFYSDEIKTEIEIARTRVGYIRGSNSTNKNIAKKKLDAILLKYADPSKDTNIEKYKNRPDLLTQYDKLKTARIGLITKTLNPEKK